VGPGICGVGPVGFEEYGVGPVGTSFILFFFISGGVIFEMPGFGGLFFTQYIKRTPNDDDDDDDDDDFVYLDKLQHEVLQNVWTTTRLMQTSQSGITEESKHTNN
jgi:hypothetical protein